MFSKIDKTAYPPKTKPVFIWDGECGFCKFWVVRLKLHTGNQIDYRTYQDIANLFPDIPLKEFKKASRLIEVDGSVYSGPDSLYQSLEFVDANSIPWHKFYKNYKRFTKLSDHGYNYITKNRPFLFKLIKAMFGDRPEKLKPYWLLYLLILATFVVLIFN